MYKPSQNDSAIFEIVILFCSSLITLLAPSFFIIGSLVFAAVVDHFMGLWASKSLGREIKIGLGMWHTFTKSLMYVLLIWMLFLMDKYVINDLITFFIGKPEVDHLFTKIGALILFSVELFSINRNYKSVKGVSILYAIVSGLKRGKEMADEVAKIKKSIKE